MTEFLELAVELASFRGLSAIVHEQNDEKLVLSFLRAQLATWFMNTSAIKREGTKQNNDGNRRNT